MGQHTNQKDLLIMSHLRRDSRLPLTEISKKTRIPVSTIFDRLKSNELIAKNTCLLNFSKIGYNIRANITLKVDRADKDAIKEFLLKHHSVNSLYKINSGFDFMLEGVFRELKDLDLFVEDLERRFRIQDKNSHFIIDDLKREAFMSDPELLHLLF